MARAIANSETLSAFSRSLRENHDFILQVKQAMDNELTSFTWDDPIGHAFIAKYREDLKPIEGKLIPNLVSYCEYLDKEAENVAKFGENPL